MLFKTLVTILAAALFLLFVGPVIIKLKEFSIIGVSLVGITMMGFDLWQSLNNKDN